MFNKIFKNYFSNNEYQSDLISYKTVNTKSSFSYSDLSNTGYKKNVIVFRCITLISRAISSVDWILKSIKGNKEVDDIIYKHEILDIINKPNALHSKNTFIEEAVSYLLLSGNCYMAVIRDSESNPKEIYTLRPDRVKVIPGKDAIPNGYEYSVGNSKKFFPVDSETGNSDVLHIKLFNPIDDWYGMSPIEVSMSSIQQHNAIALQNTSFLQNGGRPSGALMYKHSIDSNKRNELKHALKTLYEGGRNAGKILLLEGDFQWKEMGLSPKDLDFTAGKELAAKEIALAFGVPPILIGIMNSATFSNYKEARYNFWEETVIPLLNIFTDSLSSWIKQIFNTDLKLEYDLDSVQALSDRRETEWKKVNEASFLTDNEKRAAVGYTSIPN
ncbi:MAG: phage portal protein [Alphaproteobacteria bacterium]|nr:phage portal protein [Alphaproteobacteria bacterium]